MKAVGASHCCGSEGNGLSLGAILGASGGWANAELKAKDEALVPWLRRPLDLPAVRLEPAGLRKAAWARAGRPKALPIRSGTDEGTWSGMLKANE